MTIEVATVVLVETPTVYQESRIDHGRRMMAFQRPRVTAAASHPLAMMSVPRPHPMHFEDRFVSVYPVLDYIEQRAVPKAAQSTTITYRPSTRLDDPDPESQFHRIDHGLLFRYNQLVAAPAFLAYTFEVPDLCDNPWLEWVHPAPTPESIMYPFRQIYAASPPNQNLIQMFWSSPNLRIELEIDTVARKPPSDLSAFRQVLTSVAPIAPVVIVRVRATQVGYYLGITRNIGDVFDVDTAHFADSGIDFVHGGEGSQFFGWMVIVSPSTTLVTMAPSPLTAANKPRTVY
jgi:hypothetical protein